MSKFKVGDRVRPSLRFYRRLKASPANRKASGTVIGVSDYSIEVGWRIRDDLALPTRWSAGSLELITGLDTMLEISFGE